MVKVMTEDKKKKIEETIQDETIFWSMVTRIGHLPDKTPYMEVPIAELNVVGTVLMDEVDAEIERKSLVSLLGRRVPFVILSIDDEGRVLCSRKVAQMRIKAGMAQDLANQTVLTGEVVRTAPYGVYIEVNGISGLLKNNDYINIAIPVSDFMAEGDTVKVICKAISPNGKIQWAPAEKPKTENITYDVEEDTCVTGKVINMRPFENGGVGVFVRISKGLDALCLLPPDMEVNPDDQVSLKIISVTPSADQSAPPRVRGKLLRVL